MNFTADDIRHLRSRLGWSQAEMARFLNLELKTVAAWEVGSQALGDEHRNALILIYHQAESLSEKVQRRPIAEVMMKSRGLSQIHDMEVIEGMDGMTQSHSQTRGRS